mgnify:CR=1 FL=1
MLKKNLVMYVILVPLLLFSVPTTPVSASPGATLKIEPETLTVGPPIPTTPFKINVTVYNVTDLFNWQIKVFYNTTILNCTAASYPPDHVFAGKFYLPIEPVMYQNYVLFGCTLMGAETGFDGDGILCQLEFKALAEGKSYLNFSEPYGGDTFLWDSDMVEIPDGMDNGSVTVLPEFSSLLVMPLLMIATLTAVYLAAKRPLKKR